MTPALLCLSIAGLIALLAAVVLLAALVLQGKQTNEILNDLYNAITDDEEGEEGDATIEDDPTPPQPRHVVWFVKAGKE